MLSETGQSKTSVRGTIVTCNSRFLHDGPSLSTYCSFGFTAGAAVAADRPHRHQRMCCGIFPYYAAPEALHGPFTDKLDVYSFGVVIAEAVVTVWGGGGTAVPA